MFYYKSKGKVALKVLMINTEFKRGGAAKIARTLYQALNKRDEITCYFAYGSMIIQFDPLITTYKLMKKQIITLLALGLMTFTVTRTGDAEANQTVDIATSIETGDNSEIGDFTANSDTLTFAASVTSQTFDVTIADDSAVEGGGLPFWPADS